MTTPAEYDFTWVRGSTTPLRMTFMNGDNPVPYTDIRLTVFAGRNLAWRLTLADNSSSSGDPGTVKQNAAGDISFIPTAAMTRQLIQTPNDGTTGKNTYEVEVRNSLDEEVFVMGTIAAVGGLNDDEVS